MDRLKAFKLRNNWDKLEKLAANEDFFAQYYLAEMYFFGENGKINLSKAIELYMTSFENGCGDSALRLGDLYHTSCISVHEKALNISKDDDYANELYLSGFELLKKQFEGGDHLAADLISSCYFGGRGVKYDFELGVKWMKIYEQNLYWYLQK